MKQQTFLSLICFVAVALAPLANAQQTDKEVPQPKMPLIPKMPDRVDFRIDFYHNFDNNWERSPQWRTASDARSILVKSVLMSIDSTSQTTRVLTEWTDGSVYTSWFVLGVHITPRTNGEGYFVVEDRSSVGNYFAELSWIRLENYKGVLDFGGREVFVFREAIAHDLANNNVPNAPGFEGNPDDENFSETEEEVTTLLYKTDERVVYLDLETQLPLLSNDGHAIRIYNINTQPGNRLNPPRDLVQMLQDREEAIQDRVALPGNPAG